MVSNSSYCQYPMVKKIGNDSVVLMTLKQGDEINNNFRKLKDSISYLQLKNDSLKMDFRSYQIRNGQRLQTIYNEWAREFNQHNQTKVQLDTFRSMYMANKLIYLDREKKMQNEIKHITIFATILGILSVIAAHY